MFLNSSEHLHPLCLVTTKLVSLLTRKESIPLKYSKLIVLTVQDVFCLKSLCSFNMDFNLFSIFVNRHSASKGIPSFLVEKQDKYINNFAFPYKASFLLEM